MTRLFSIYIIFICFFRVNHASAQDLLNDVDSLQLINRSEKVIEDYEKLLNALATVSEEEAQQAMAYSYSKESSGLRRIFLNENSIIETDFDSAYYKNKKKDIPINKYLTQFWSSFNNSTKPVVYISGIICDTFFWRGDSLISIVYFNTIFDGSPQLIAKRKAHLTARKYNKEWKVYIYEISFNELEPFKNNFIDRFKQESTKVDGYLIPKREPVFYNSYKTLPDFDFYSESGYKKLNTIIKDAEELYSKYLFNEAATIYKKTLLLIPDHDYLKKRVENCRILSKMLVSNEEKKQKIKKQEPSSKKVHARMSIGFDFAIPNGNFASSDYMDLYDEVFYYPKQYFGFGLNLNYEKPFGNTKLGFKLSAAVNTFLGEKVNGDPVFTSMISLQPGLKYYLTQNQKGFYLMGLLGAQYTSATAYYVFYGLGPYGPDEGDLDNKNSFGFCYAPEIGYCVNHIGIGIRLQNFYYLKFNHVENSKGSSFTLRFEILFGK